MTAKGTGRALQLECLERRAMLAGDVSVEWADGDLKIIGDEQDNQLQVEILSSNEAGNRIEIRALEETQLNGGEKTLSVRGVRGDLLVELDPDANENQGDDWFQLKGPRESPIPLFAFGLQLDAGGGDDVVQIGTGEEKGSAPTLLLDHLNLSAPGSAGDAIQISGVSIQGSAEIRTGKGPGDAGGRVDLERAGEANGLTKLGGTIEMDAVRVGQDLFVAGRANRLRLDHVDVDHDGLLDMLTAGNPSQQIAVAGSGIGGELGVRLEGQPQLGIEKTDIKRGMVVALSGSDPDDDGDGVPTATSVRILGGSVGGDVSVQAIEKIELAVEKVERAKAIAGSGQDRPAPATTLRIVGTDVDGDVSVRAIEKIELAVEKVEKVESAKGMTGDSETIIGGDLSISAAGGSVVNLGDAEICGDVDLRFGMQGRDSGMSKADAKRARGVKLNPANPDDDGEGLPIARGVRHDRGDETSLAIEKIELAVEKVERAKARLGGGGDSPAPATTVSLSGANVGGDVSVQTIEKLEIAVEKVERAKAVVDGGDEGSVATIIGGDLTVSAGGGSSVNLSSTNIGRNVDLTFGAGKDDLPSTVGMIDATIGGRFSATAAEGSDASLKQVEVGGDVNLRFQGRGAASGESETPELGSEIELAGSSVGGSLRIDTGSLNDWIQIDGTRIGRALMIRTGGGDDVATIGTRDAVFAHLGRIDGGDGDDTLRLGEVEWTLEMRVDRWETA